MITPEQAVATAILICIAGAVVTFLVSGNRTLAGWLAFLAVSVSAGMIFSAVAKVVTGGASARTATFLAMPMLGFALRIHVDGLTAIFLLLAALISVPAAFYSIVYMRNYEGYSVARYYPYFLLFLAAMYGLRQHHRHDVVLLHLLADDDPAGLCADPVRAQRTRPTSAPPTSFSS